MDIVDRPRAPDYYALLRIDAKSTDAEVETALLRAEDQRRIDRSIGLVYSRDEYDTLVTQARMVLFDVEKKTAYDGLHSLIELVWDTFYEGLRSHRNSSYSMDSVLWEMFSERVMREQRPTSTPAPRDPVEMLETGAEGCYICGEDERDPDDSYKFCSGCRKGTHERCWNAWESACRSANRLKQCGHCRRPVAV